MGYDCAAGFSNWQRGWSEGKKAFCCRTQGKGCPPTAPPTPPPPPAPTTSLPYDCNAGYHGCYHCLLKQWSVAKLAWCCQHTGRGCPTPAPLMQQDVLFVLERVVLLHTLVAAASRARWTAPSSSVCCYFPEAVVLGSIFLKEP